MSALARAEEALRIARRELEAAQSELPAYVIGGPLPFVRAEVQDIRQRLERIRRAVADLEPEPPKAA